MLSSIWTWIKEKYAAFEAFLVRTAPGVKTKIVVGLGAIGNGAAALQGYITGIPTNKFVTGEQIAIGTFILFTLAYWFKDMGTRVATREDLIDPTTNVTSNA